MKNKQSLAISKTNLTFPLYWLNCTAVPSIAVADREKKLLAAAPLILLVHSNSVK